MGAISQFRSFGGLVGLAVATNVLNSYVKSKLSGIITADQLEGLLQSIGIVYTFPPHLQNIVRSTFADGYNLQMKAMIGFAAAQILVLPLMWEKELRRLA